jgi:hypothetical protein
MPRSTKEILAQAEEFAKRFEDYEPTTGDDGLDARSLRASQVRILPGAPMDSRLNAPCATRRRCRALDRGRGHGLLVRSFFPS